MTPDHEERLGAEVSRDAEPGAVLPKRAGLTNAAFKILSSGLNFLLVPLYIHVYGLSTYGALSLLLALGQYLSVLDVGITGTLVQTYLRVRTHGDYSYFRLRQLAISFLFAAGGGLAVGGGLSAQWWAPAVGLKQVSDLSLAIFSAGSLVVLMLVSNCLNSAYVATLRFGWVNVYSLSLNILPQLVSAGAYAWIGSLGPSLTLGAVAACAVVGLQSYVLRREERPIRPKHVSARVSTRLFLESSATFSLQTLLGALLMPLLQTVVGMRFGNQANALLDVTRHYLFVVDTAHSRPFPVGATGRDGSFVGRHHARIVEIAGNPHLGA